MAGPLSSRRPPRLLSLGGLLAALVPISACIGSPPADDPNAIHIGALLPFTGEVSASGVNYERALLLAEEQINKAGGIGGKPVRLVSRDSFSSVERGLASARELLDQHVVAMIGPEEPELAQALAPMLVDAGIPQLLTGVVVPPRIDSSEWSSIAPSADTLGCALGLRIYNDARRHVVVLYQDDDFFGALAQSIVSHYNYQLKPAVDSARVPATALAFPSKADSYLPQVEAAQALSSDAIVVLGYPLSAAAVVRDADILHSKSAWYFAPTLDTEIFMRNAPPGVLEGGLGVSPALPDDWTAFASFFANRWSGEQPLNGSYFYYDALVLLSLAIQSANFASGGTPSYDLIRASLVRVSRSPGVTVTWDQIATGLSLTGTGQDVNYQGASGNADLNQDAVLDVGNNLVRFWTIMGDTIKQEAFGVCLVSATGG